jgi:hypothetical protein
MEPKQRRSKTGGRRAGTPNRITGAMREAVQVVYNDMGGHAAFTRWAKKNKTEFYRIASKLIPVEIKDTSDKRVTVVIDSLSERRPMPIVVPAEALPAPVEDPDGATGS